VIKIFRSSRALSIAVFISFLLVIAQPLAEAKSIEGKVCKKAGLQQLQDRDLFTCLNVGSSLRWKITDDNTSDFAPFPINGPTWQQLADIRDAEAKKALEQLAIEQAKAKAAAELKAKQEAELKAKQEAELKAKQEAELKAKQEAELKAKQDAELKAKQEAELKAKQEAELKAKQEAELKAKQEAELKAKQEAEAKAAAELKAKQEAEAKAAAGVPDISGLTIGKLLWSDEFVGQAGSQASSMSWTPRFCGHAASNGGGTCHNNEQQYYIPEAITQDGSDSGNLIITTKRITQPPTNGGICYVGLCSFTSGRLDTQGKLSFKYGFIEARIKMPAGSGNWPAFWMLGDNINQVGWPYSGEMDIVEIHSDRPTLTTSATHFSVTDTPNTCCGNHRFVFDEVPVGVDVSFDFHTYAIAWLPNSISYYFDGRLVGNTTPSRVSGKWAFNEKFFLILNNAVGSFGGSWASLQSSTMKIDWVRSYQLNGFGEVFTE
jgi:beta-glucanase (GH16 family)